MFFLHCVCEACQSLQALPVNLLVAVSSASVTLSFGCCPPVTCWQHLAGVHICVQVHYCRRHCHFHQQSAALGAYGEHAHWGLWEATRQHGWKGQCHSAVGTSAQQTGPVVRASPNLQTERLYHIADRAAADFCCETMSR